MPGRRGHRVAPAPPAQRRRGSPADGDQPGSDDPPNTVVHVRPPRPHGPDEPGRPATSSRSAARPGWRPSGSAGARAATPAGAARRSSPSRSSWPGARPWTGSWWSGSRRPDPDRGARGRRARRALRGQGQPPVAGRQRLPGQGAERAAVHGGRLRRHRQGPQRRAVRRRGQLRRQRPGGRVQADRVGAQVRPVRAGAGHQGPGRAQGRPADQPGQPARPLPGLRARRRR